MGPSPIVTSRGISPKGHDCSPEKLTRGVFESTRRDLIDGFSFKKQCSYVTSHELPPSRYALFTCLPDMYTLIMTGSDEPTFGRGGNVISPIPSWFASLFFALRFLPLIIRTGTLSGVSFFSSFFLLSEYQWSFIFSLLPLLPGERDALI
ncbi:hypothetical protein Tco_1151675 [Tanacetum coccineum]